MCIQAFLVLLEYHQSVPEQLVNNTWISCSTGSIQFWFCCCLAESDESNTRQKILLLFPVQILSATVISVCQWYDPSSSCSSWSWWRTIFVIILDTFVRKPLLGNGSASIVIHFRSLLGMTVLLNKESRIRLWRKLAQDSLMLLRAQVFLLLLDPLSAVSNSLLDLSSSLWSWISFTKTLCFCGYLNVRCVHRISNWRNRNFYPISINNFHNLNCQQWSNDLCLRE